MQYNLSIFASVTSLQIGRERSKLENNGMQTLLVLWLILGLLASIIVVAALMLSAKISREEGVTESYENQETSEVVREMYPRRVKS